MTYEFFEPGAKTKHLGSIRLGRQSAHISAVSKILREDLLATFRNGGLEFVWKFKDRWCEMISVDWSNDEATWIRRALGGGQGVSLDNKKILLLRKEGRPLHKYEREHVHGDWFKIAIEDTTTGEVFLRTLFNGCGWIGRSFPTTDGWSCFGSKPKVPSTVGADKTFWLDLAQVIDR